LVYEDALLPGDDADGFACGPHAQMADDHEHPDQRDEGEHFLHLGNILSVRLMAGNSPTVPRSRR
jgi:hypothetical protein